MSSTTPLVRDSKTGNWKVERTVRQRTTKTTLATDNTDQYLVWLVVGSIVLCFVPLLPCYAPAALLVWFGRRYAVPPQGVWKAVAWCTLLGTVPGIGGAIACTKGVAQYVADTYAPNLPQQFAAYWNAPDGVPAPLDSLWQPDGIAFALTLGPVWLALILYIFVLGRSDARAIAARVTDEKGAQTRTLSAIADRAVVALGQPRARTWDADSQSWNIAPAHDDIREADILTLTPTHHARHTLVVAPTRAGKTANVIRPMIGFCRRTQTAAIFFDPKGNDLDPRQFSRNFSLRADEAATSFRLCLIDPDLSPQKAAAKLAEGLIPETDPPFFSNAAREAFEAIMLMYCAVYHTFPELSDILIYTKSHSEREKLVKGLTENRTTGSAHGQGGDVARRQYRLEQDALIKYYGLEESAGSKNDPLATLRHAIAPLAEGQFVDYVTTKPDFGITIPEMLNARHVTRFGLSVDEGEAGKTLGRIVIRLYTDFVLSPRADDSYLKLIVIDEAHNYLCPALVEGIPQSAGRNAGYMLAVQNLGQIREKLKESGTQIIFANSKNRIVQAGIDTEDAYKFSADIGQQALPTVTTSDSATSGKSRGQNTHGALSGGGSSRGANIGQSNSTSRGYTLRAVWLPSEIATIPRFHALVRHEDGTDEPQWTLIRFLTPDEKASLIPPPVQQSSAPTERKKLASTPLDEVNPGIYHPTLPMPDAKDGAAKAAPASGTPNTGTPPPAAQAEQIPPQLPGDSRAMGDETMLDGD